MTTLTVTCAFRGWTSRLAVGLIALLALAAGPALAAQDAGATAEAQTAEGMVRETSDAVLALIEEAQGYAEEDPERFFGEVEALLAPVVDFEGFARSVMAVHYRDATPEQRERFEEKFRTGLVRTYALALTEFKDGEVEVVPPDRPPRDPRRQTVKMEIRTSSGEVYPVLYSVARNRSGEWQVRNLIVNGVNMGLTFRSQFDSAMNDPKYGGDLDKVIDNWGQMIKEEAPGLEEATETGQEGDQA